MSVVLACTHHDPNGRLWPLAQSALPTLKEMFTEVVFWVSCHTSPQTLQQLQKMGVHAQQNLVESDPPLYGQDRRCVIEEACGLGAKHILYCDSDRVFHWVNHYPYELAHIIAMLANYDLLVLGRTERAFSTHPKSQQDTEQMVNHLFQQVSGQKWDITTAARGLSRQAAITLMAESVDDTIGVDASWPLLLLQQPTLTTGYVTTEGLEFETADRNTAEIQQAGSLEQWKEQIANNPHEWLFRLRFAQDEIQAMLPFLKKA